MLASPTNTGLISLCLWMLTQLRISSITLTFTEAQILWILSSRKIPGSFQLSKRQLCMLSPVVWQTIQMACGSVTRITTTQHLNYLCWLREVSILACSTSCSNHKGWKNTSLWICPKNHQEVHYWQLKQNSLKSMEWQTTHNAIV